MTENKSTDQQSLLKQVFDTLVSMKFAIIILIALGSTSLLSMLINEYPNFFTEGTFLHTIFRQHSPYSSWWYTILLWFLILSVFLCVVKNIGPTFRSIFNTNYLISDNIKKLLGAKQIKTNNTLNPDSIKKELRKKLFKVSEIEKNGEKLIAARKFRWGGLGHIITHTSLLILVIGSLIYTSTTRQEFRYLIAEEFKDTDYYENFPELYQWHFEVTDDFHPTMVVDSFRVRYYDDNHGPAISDFRSYVRLFDHDGTMLKQHELTVNSPLVYKHVSIHQSDYKPLVDEFFMNVPNRRQIVAQKQSGQEFERDETHWITGLSLRANKGKSIIFAGMLISSIGLMMAFMFWPRYIWVAIKNNKATIAGRSPKNKLAFQQDLDNLINRLENE